jgi:hypothetical protein
MISRQRASIVVVATLASGALATLSTVHAHDPITTRVTWNSDIARIVEARCVECHGADARDSIPLATYEQARPWAKAIREEVLTRRMPIWHAARGYGDFSNDPSLSPFEIALIVAWADGGAPKGTDAASRAKLGTESAREPSDAAERESAKRQAPGAGPRRDEKMRRPVSIEKSSRDATNVARSRRSTRDITLSCTEQPLPQGRLLAVRPQLSEGGSLGVAVRQPDGTKEIVAWIRNFDPRYPTTYWLRSPVTLRNGSRLIAESGDRCSLTATVASLR